MQCKKSCESLGPFLQHTTKCYFIALLYICYRSLTISTKHQMLFYSASLHLLSKSPNFDEEMISPTVHGKTHIPKTLTSRGINKSLELRNVTVCYDTRHNWRRNGDHCDPLESKSCKKRPGDVMWETLGFREGSFSLLVGNGLSSGW